MGSAGNQNPWAPYDRYKDCSQGFCSIYCPQWCYIIVPPPPSFGFVDEDDDTNNSSATDFSPLIIAVIGILAGAFILITYYTIISKYCRRRGRNNSSRDLEMDANHPNQASNSESWQGSTSGLDESLIKSITVHKYKRGDGLVEGTDCSVCLSEFEENESLRLLPKCSHAFHVPCIDTWLKSHSSCPLCRSNIAAAPPPAIATLVPPHHQQVLPPVEENGPHHESNVSASEYQHRSNGSVLMVVQDLEEVVSLANDHVVVPKTTSTQCLRERGDLENGENIVEIRQDGIQQFRRSVSLNSSLSQKCCVSIADVLGSHSSEEDDDDDDDDVDEDLENQMEIVQFSMEDGPFNSMESIPFSMENFQFSMEIGSSKGVEEQNCKSNLRSGVFSLVKGPLGLKRSISTGRFSFTRYGKEKNSIIPN